jgi:hypothetical protein
LPGQCLAQLWPDLGFLELDVFAGGGGEFGQQLLEFGAARLHRVELGQDLLGLVLLTGGMAGELVPVGQLVPDGGPEEHLLDRLVLGLVGDERGRLLLAVGELALPRASPAVARPWSLTDPGRAEPAARDLPADADGDVHNGPGGSLMSTRRFDCLGPGNAQHRGRSLR